MTNDPSLPTLDDIRSARQRIRSQVHLTPVLTSKSLDKRVDAECFLKCENFQKVGAFKFRGASNAILQLDDTEAARGVATHSSGNHAQAVALAARMRGIPAYIVMPDNSPSVKVDAVRGYGADISFCASTLAAREETLEKVVAETHATFIHPYNNRHIITGQGTATPEMLEQVPNLDVIITPVGGGGLLSGTAIAAKTSGINTVYGAEPKLADDAKRSLDAGKLIPLEHTDTIADGLRTSLGPLTFAAINQHVDDILTVEEDAIIDAMRYIWERMKIIIEPSAAVPVAALFSQPEIFAQQRVGVILSGGNVDLDHLPWQD